MENRWRVEGLYPVQGWTLVPGNESNSGAWVEGEFERIVSWWDDNARGELAEQALRDTLNESLSVAREPGTLTTLLHWPLPLPVPSRVRVVPATGGPVDPRIWVEAGFDVDEYPGARMGPALKCIASRDEVSEGRSLHLSTAAFVFSASDLGLVVVIESGSREIFQFTLSRVPLLLSTLSVYRPDGLEFKSDPVSGITRNLNDEWESVPNA